MHWKLNTCRWQFMFYVHSVTLKLLSNIPCNTSIAPFWFLCKIGDFETALFVCLQNKVYSHFLVRRRFSKLHLIINSWQPALVCSNNVNFFVIFCELAWAPLQFKKLDFFKTLRKLTILHCPMVEICKRNNYNNYIYEKSKQIFWTLLTPPTYLKCGKSPK